MKTRQRSIEEELRLETDLMKQSTDPKAELVTKRHLVTSIQLVYKLQNENWVRWPLFAHHNEVVMAERFSNIVEKMYETIPDRPPVNYATYQKFKRIQFVKFNLTIVGTNGIDLWQDSWKFLRIMNNTKKLLRKKKKSFFYCLKFKPHYSGIEWNSLVSRLTRIYFFMNITKIYLQQERWARCPVFV